MAEAGKSRRREWVSGICWFLAAVFLLWAMVRTAGVERGYPLVQLMSYTPYVLMLSMLGLVFVVLCRRWLAAGFLAVAVIALLLAVLPRALGGPETVDGGQPVRVLSVNLRRGHAETGEVVSLARMKDADLVFLQELTAEQVAELDRAGFAADYRYRVLSTPPGSDGGGGIFSRWPLQDLGRLDTTLQQPMAAVRVPGSIPITAISVHPMAPLDPEATRLWNDDYEQFPPAGTTDLPAVLAGDFNATLDHENLRDLIDTGYRDAGEVLGSGLAPTWPSSLERWLPVTLDHVLAERGISFAAYDVLEMPGSDHRAVYAELLLPPVRR